MRISLGNTRAFKVSSLNILENIGNRRAFKVVSLNIMENVGNRREICLRPRTFPENATYLCMQDTFARATHSAKRARDDRVSCIQYLSNSLG